MRPTLMTSLHINDFPYELLARILEEVARAYKRDGPTYTFGFSQASLLLQEATLQRYVRGPVPSELLEWDATSPIRSVCWKWHEWAVQHSLRDVYIRCGKGGEVSMQTRLTTSQYCLILTSGRGGQSFPTGGRVIHFTSSLTDQPALLSTATLLPPSSGLQASATTFQRWRLRSSAYGFMASIVLQQTVLSSKYSPTAPISHLYRFHGPRPGT
jgi:hypothetical protein